MSVRARPQWQAFAGAAWICAMLSCVVSDLRAQTSRADPVDVQGWYSLGVNAELPHRWRTSLDYRFRTVANASTYRGSFVTAEIGYALAPRLTVLASYRPSHVDGTLTHRIVVGGEGSRKFGSATLLSFRPMLQHRLWGGSDDETSGARDLLRTRLQLRQQLMRTLSVYISTEPFFNVGDGYKVDNSRNTVGTKYEFATGRTLDLYYIYRPDYAKEYNRLFHVVGVKLAFDVRYPGRKG